MKKNFALFFLIILFPCIPGCSRSDTFKNITYSENVTIKGVPQDELYRRIAIWVTFTFRRTLSHVMYADGDEGIIKIRYIYSISQDMAASIRSDITVEVRAERYTISFSDVWYQALDEKNQPYGEETTLPSQDVADKLLNQWKILIGDLKDVIPRL